MTRKEEFGENESAFGFFLSFELFAQFVPLCGISFR
jgi:hypothetical protein